jgi:hypothetical protein
MLERVGETLAGPAVYVTLWPFTRRERLGAGRTGAWSELLRSAVGRWPAMLVAHAGPPEDRRAAVRVGGFPTGARPPVHEVDFVMETFPLTRRVHAAAAPPPFGTIRPGPKGRPPQRPARTRVRPATRQIATANTTDTAARPVWTALKPNERASSPQMFQMRVPHTHTVHAAAARSTRASRRVMPPTLPTDGSFVLMPPRVDATAPGNPT